MTLPSTNISLGDIYQEPNGATAANTKASEIMKLTYFEGPPFGSTISFSAWGQYGNTAGADRIYGLTGSNVNNAIGDFRGLTYWYNNTGYKVAAFIDNTKQPAPPPPYDNQVTVEVYLYDSTDTHQYALNSTPLAPMSNTTIDITSGLGNEPILAIGYWEVKVTLNDSFPAGGNVTIDINGSTYVAGAGLSSNSQATFSWNDTGATSAPVASTGQGYDGLYFEITVN